MKLPFGSRSKTMMALALPAGLVLMASLLVAPTPPAMAQTAVATPSGNGYWLVATDGGIFAYGDAGFFGSLGDRVLNKPITGMVPTPTGQGYWLVASDGGIFAFGDAEFFGSAGAIALNKPIVGMANSGEESGFSAAGAKGSKGDVGPAGPPGLAANYVGAEWSTIDRNVLGGGDSDLRAGPESGGALGTGSLGIRTGALGDKTSFGNTTLFKDDLVKDLTTIGYSVYTTTENWKLGANNLPNLAIEIDPNVDAWTTNYSSLVFVPDGLTDIESDSKWTPLDAMTDGMWGLTGSPPSCKLGPGTLCTWPQILDVLEDDGDDAKISFSVAFSKGSATPTFSGAVDALKINSQTFDFEPFGVLTN